MADLGSPCRCHPGHTQLWVLVNLSPRPLLKEPLAAFSCRALPDSEKVSDASWASLLSVLGAAPLLMEGLLCRPLAVLLCVSVGSELLVWRVLVIVPRASLRRVWRCSGQVSGARQAQAGSSGFVFDVHMKAGFRDTSGS